MLEQLPSVKNLKNKTLMEVSRLTSSRLKIYCCRWDGRLQDWWNDASTRNFSKVSKCVNQQYQDHFRRPLRIDARSILIEVSLADQPVAR